MKKLISALLVLSVFALQSGCASYRAMGTLSGEIGNYPQRKEQSGISVAIKPLKDNEIRDIFKRNLQKKDVLPVFMVIENQSGVDIEFKKSMVNARLFTANEVTDKGEFNVFWRVAVFSPFIINIFFWPLLIPAICGGLGAVEANRQMRQDYVQKEFKEGVIASGKSAAGFIYFDKRVLTSAFSIKLSVNDKSEEFNFDLNHQ